MIEGGGLGVYAPEDIGGMDVQVPNGVVDIAVEDNGPGIAPDERATVLARFARGGGAQLQRHPFQGCRSP